MKVEQKLREMGLELPELPKPNGLYAPSRRVGNLIYIAGQTPDIHGVRQVVGVVGEDLTIEDGQRSAQICALNILSVLKAELGDLDKVKQFVQIYQLCALRQGIWKSAAGHRRGQPAVPGFIWRSGNRGKTCHWSQ